MRGHLPYMLFFLPLLGCQLEPPRYGDTEFACSAPLYVCPSDYVCLDGVCRAESDISDPLPPDAGAFIELDSGASGPDAHGPWVDASPAPLVTIVVSGTDSYDTYVNADSTNENFSTERDVRVDSGPTKIGLLRFDLSSIPPAAVVESAALVVNVTEPLETGELVAHRMLESWSEDDATWNQRKVGTPWATAGVGPGSYDPTQLFTIAPRDIGTYAIPLSRTVVQAWVTQSPQNHGIRWMSTSPDGRGAEFKSSDSSQTNLHPLIRIQYR